MDERTRMGLFKRLFGAPDRGTAPQLYAAIVATGRAPHWYAQGAVPDTIDGRFDMIAAILSLVLLRLEKEAEAIGPSTALAECFIEDMDGQLREIGIGDVVVGKHMGRMMGMVGGRLGAYRAGLAGDGLRGALVRNLYRGDAPGDAALSHVEAGLLGLRDGLAAMPTAAILAGELPR
jgi:cytochrome b pre-mRNA-processing protein 3